MLRANFKKHILNFKQPGGTSRGVLNTREAWYLSVWDTDDPEKIGIGECGIIPKLSIDDRPDFEEKIIQLVSDIQNHKYWFEEGLTAYPAIRFGLETALIDLQNSSNRILFPSKFTSGENGIPINGLIWMGNYDFMRNQIIEKIENGYRCIKLKIGAINFDDELKLLRTIRQDFNADELELRVDANGAFQPKEVLEKLKQLSDFEIHSIEQPIKQNQWDQMAELCLLSPMAIALDEELIGATRKHEIRTMLKTIRPDFIILKPGLLGGFQQGELFIREAEKLKIGWWVTSALESNIGLNAIAQWTFTLNSKLPQGLGTGQLYLNNIPSPLEINAANLFYRPEQKWNLKLTQND